MWFEKLDLNAENQDEKYLNARKHRFSTVFYEKKWIIFKGLNYV